MKDSGVGRENGIEAFESCQDIFMTALPSRTHIFVDSQSKSTIVNTSTEEEMRKDDWFSVSDMPHRYG